MLSVFVLRFMTLGSKFNSKFRNVSVLLTEQVSDQCQCSPAASPETSHSMESLAFDSLLSIARLTFG